MNAVCLAYITTFFYNIYTGVFGLELVALPVRLVALCVGVVICCLGLSMYQMPDEGVAPYDSLSLIMTERWPKIPYFWHRMSNDVLCALICYLTGGVVGIGTLVTAFGLGPVIHFFNRVFTGKLLAGLMVSEFVVVWGELNWLRDVAGSAFLVKRDAREACAACRRGFVVGWLLGCRESAKSVLQKFELASCSRSDSGLL